MCGIVGCKIKRPLTPDDVARMRGLRDDLAHRGPDGAGEYIEAENGLYLGHRRLSIIDPEPRSAQPFVDGKAVITYNGEIYNYLELRQELGAGESYVTSSDTEVLLKAWQRWGAACLDKLDGMYAFAVQDKDGLHLVTDLFGEKPLYLYESEEGIYFASEAGALIRAFGLCWEPGDSEIADFLHLGYIRPPQTGFKNLVNVAPATHITISKNGQRQERVYWSPSFPKMTGRPRPFEASQIDILRDLLCQSLEKRLRSDVPIGLFLSAGIDSSLVAALAVKELGIQLQSYTVAFNDETDESNDATNIARYLGMPHTLIPTLADDLQEDLPRRLLGLYGVPNDNMTVLAVSKMCAGARKYLTVALSGLGGDELFMGYNKYDNLYRRQNLYNLSPYVQWCLPLLKHVPVSKIRTAAQLLSGTPEQQYFRIKNGGAQDTIAEMGYGLIADFPVQEKAPLYLRARQTDLLSSMPQSYIPAVDRGSMEEAIEVRTPFLNRKLLDYVWSLDQSTLIHFGKKGMLLSLLGRYMPLDLLTQRKQGFVYPMPSGFMEGRKKFSRERWHNKQDEIRKQAKAGSKDHARLALRLSILSALDRSEL